MSFSPLVPAYVVWAATAVAFALALLLVFARTRAALVGAIALALFVLALANPSFTREDRDPLSSVAVVIVDKSPSQEFGDRTQQTEAARAQLAERLAHISGLGGRFLGAWGSERRSGRRNRRLATVQRAQLGPIGCSARPGGGRDHDHRRARARRSGRRRGARLQCARARLDHRPQERARPPGGAGHRGALPHRRAVADHHGPR